MTINELVEELKELAETAGGNSEIQVAYQPGWPLKAEITEVDITEDGIPVINAYGETSYR